MSEAPAAQPLAAARAAAARPGVVATASGRAVQAGVALILIVASGADLVRALWRYEHVPPAAVRTAVPGRAPAAVLDSILASHLFGVRAGEGAAPLPADVPLIVTGIVALPDPTRGVAIIGRSAAGALAFRVGEQVGDAFELSAIYVDHVILSRAGSERALYLPRADLGPLLAGPAAAAAATPPSPEEEARVEAETQRDPLYRMAAGDWTFGGLNPRPRIVGGRVVGIALTPRSAEAQALARGAGLAPGDVLTAIDGAPLASAARLPDQLRALEGRGQAQLTVRHPSGEVAVVVISLPKVEHDDG